MGKQLISHNLARAGYGAAMGNSLGTMGYPLGDLADLYRGPGPWTVVQLEVGRDVQPAGDAIKLRWRNVRDLLEKEGAPSADLSAVEEALESPVQGSGGAVRYLLVGRDGVVADEVLDAAAGSTNTGSNGALPVLAPLVDQGTRRLPYLLVEAGREGARLTAAQRGNGPETVEEVSGETLHLTKVRGGGWAHRRMQQTAEEVWRRNAVEVAEDVERLRRQVGVRLVVLTGDVRAREQVAAHLTSEARNQLVELDVHTKPAGSEDAEVSDTVAGRLAELARQERLEALDRYGDGRTAGMAVSGLGEVVHALRQGQVEVLMVDAELLAGRTVLALTTEPWLALSPGEVTGTDVLAEVDAVEGIIRAGALTDAALLSYNRDGDGAGIPDGQGVAALLRWPVGPRSAE